MNQHADAIRLVAALGAVEMALVRRDEVVGPLLAQAARAGIGLPCAEHLHAAAGIARRVDLGGDAVGDRAARKVVQALCRAAAQEAQALAIAGG